MDAPSGAPTNASGGHVAGHLHPAKPPNVPAASKPWLAVEDAVSDSSRGVDVASPRLSSASPSAVQKKMPMPISNMSEAVSLFLQSRQCLRMLEEYAEREYSSENLYFWRHISEYRKMIEKGESIDLIEAHENLMFTLYLNDTDFALNLSSCLKEEARRDPHDPIVWGKIQAEVANLIRSGPYLTLAMKISTSVSKSWALTMSKKPIADIGKLFYSILFEIDPMVRPLFKADISVQAIMLAEMIDSSVRLLVDLEKLLDSVLLMGRRHALYGVVPSHFKSVGEALLSTLAEILGDEFDYETERSWITVYELLSTLMVIAIDPNQIDGFVMEAPANHGRFKAVQSYRRDSKNHVAVDVGDNSLQKDNATEINAASTELSRQSSNDIPSNVRRRQILLTRVLPFAACVIGGTLTTLFVTRS